MTTQVDERRGNSPFDGKWAANIARSQRHANHQFQSAMLHFDVSGQQVTLTQSGVNMAGKHESSTLTLHADGEPRAVSPEAPDVVVITRWVGACVLETTGKKGDVTLGRGTYEVSADGLTLTATVSGVDAQGAAFDQVIVFDRR